MQDSESKDSSAAGCCLIVIALSVLVMGFVIGYLVAEAWSLFAR